MGPLLWEHSFELTPEVLQVLEVTTLTSLVGLITYNFGQTVLKSGMHDISFSKMNCQLLLYIRRFIWCIKASHQLSILLSFPFIHYRGAKLQNTNYFAITFERLHGDSICTVLVATGLLQSFFNDPPIFLLLLSFFWAFGMFIFLAPVPFMQYFTISHVLWLILQVFCSKLKIIKITKRRVMLVENQLALLIKLLKNWNSNLSEFALWWQETS